MFSDYLRVYDEAPTKILLIIAGSLVIVCQLVAMYLVADGQVEKAELRDASQASAIAASAGCFERHWGVALSDCHRVPATAVAQSVAER